MSITEPDVQDLHDPGRLDAVARARRSLPRAPTLADGIARLAARLLAAPMGAVTLVGEQEEYFAGRHDLPPRLADGRRAPLDLSVCKYIVVSGDAMSCRDMRTAEEPRLRDHRLATELGMRAFLGVPLQGPANRSVGALTVFDRRPRRWSDGHRRTLAAVAELLQPFLLRPEPPAAGVAAELDSVSLLDSVREAFVAVDGDGAIRGWNLAARHMFGWTAGDALGRPFTELIVAEEEVAAAREVVTRLAAMPAELQQTLRGRARHRDGHLIPVELTISTVHGADGPNVCAFFTDTTPQQTARDDAVLQRGFLSAVLDNLYVGVIACGPDGRVVIANQALREVHQLPATAGPAAVGAMTDRLHHLDGTPMALGEMPLHRALRGETVRDLEMLINVEGQRSRTFTVNAGPIDHGGRRLGAVAAVHEVTQHRRIERFRLLDVAIAGQLARSRSIVQAASPVLRLLAEALGWPYAELWLVDDVTDRLRPIAHWAAEGRGPAGPIPARLGRGEGISGTVWASGEPLALDDLPDVGSVVSVPVPAGRGAGVAGVLTCFADSPQHDWTVLTTLLTAVAAQLGQFLSGRLVDDLGMQLDRARNDFVALVGHEMRTPLTSITSYAELLLDDPAAMSPGERQLLEVIHRNATGLQAIVDELLDLAAMQSGHLNLVLGDIDLAEVLAAACAAIRPVAAANGVEVHCAAPATCPCAATAAGCARSSTTC